LRATYGTTHSRQNVSVSRGILPEAQAVLNVRSKVGLALPNRSSSAASQLTRDWGSTFDMVEGCTRTKLSRDYRAACQFRYRCLFCDDTGLIAFDDSFIPRSTPVR
jgi:hypothetical protein